MKRKLLVGTVLALTVLLVTGLWVFAEEKPAPAPAPEVHREQMGGMMGGDMGNMGSMMQMMSDPAMQQMMQAMNSPEGQEMMQACTNFMNGMTQQPAQQS